MKKAVRLLALLAFTGLTALALRAENAAVPAPVYELRTYSTLPGRLPALLARFRDHTCQLFTKHGMTNLAYWTPADAKDGAGDKLVYLLAHASREAAAASWKKFQADPEWKAARTASEADGKIVAKVESVFLAATDYSPAIAPVAKNPARIFELRTYTTPDEARLAALDARFRGGETALFAAAGMTGIVYTHPLDADKGAGHTLIYLLAHADRDAAKASWKKFRDDPAWVKMKADSEKAAGGSLTSKTESLFLVPVDFSPLK